MEEQKNILTFDDALESDTIDFKTEDYFKPNFNLNVSNQMTMEEAVKNQGINDRIISDIKNNLKPEASVLESIGAGVSSAARAIKNTIPDALDSLTIMSKNTDWFYPNMTEEERDNMALEIALTRKANKSFEAMESHYNGTDNWITMGSAAIAQFLGQMSLNALVPGLGSLQMGVQTASDTALDYAVDVMEKEGYNMRKAGNWKDNAITLANGAVQAFIEHKLGAERLVNGAFSRAMTGTLRAGATTAFSEGTEEFAQEWTGYLFNTLAGHEDRTVGQVLSDALTGAVVGGLIGGTAGATAYKTKTSDIAKILREKFGYEPKLADAISQDMVDNAMYKSKEEMTIQAQFKYHYGENYNNFVNKVKTLLKEAGWERRNPGKDLNAFAQLNADTLISPFINMANMSNMPAKDFFDIANMEVIGNQVVLNTQRFDNPNEVRRRIKEVEAQIKEENLKQGIDNRARKQQLQSQKKTLQTILNKLKFEEMFDREAINNQLAKIQQEDVENKMPEVASSLKGIVEDWDFNHKGMYVGKHRIPVNMLVVDLKDINISHMDGEVNPNYKNKQLQNRVRNDIKDDVRLQQKSNNLQPESLVFGNDTTTGAPVVNMDGDIIAGNGRGELLRRAYINQEQVPGLKERIEAYKNLLRQQGYDIEGMEMPVLIRQIDVPVEQQVAIASVSNIPTMSAFQHSQRAKNDAKVIADKNLTDPMAFLSSLTPDEKVEFELEKGNIDQLALDRRFNDAVMALILNDNKLFENLILGNKLPKKIISGISNAVKTSNLLERLKTDAGMREDIRNALISAPKTNSDNLAMNIQQATVGEDNPFNKNSLLLLFTEGNSLQISEGLNNILGRIEQYEDLISKDSLLKDQTPIYSQEDLMKQTLKDIALTKEYFTDKGQIRTDFQDGSKQQKLSQNLLALFTSETPSQSGSVEQQVMSEEDNLLFQSDIKQNAIDLSEDFANIKKGEITEKDVENYINNLIGKPLDTSTSPLQIQITNGNKAHIISSNVKLNKRQNIKHKTALNTLERVINNAIKTGEGDVDLEHNTRESTIKHKKGLEKYIYFESPITINNKNFTVNLATEQVKGQDSNLLDLYNVRVKTTPERIINDTLSGADTFNITDNDNIVKQKQLQIIQETNPMFDDIHTGIRKVEDIKTWNEVIKDGDNGEQFTWGDYTLEDAQRDLAKGQITIYSSKPIENGTFVSTSERQAKDYAGNGKVYKKTIPLNNIAWINGDEGQYTQIDTEVLYQSSRYNGFFDADLKTILLGENMNEGTLQHEVAHFFLDRCFEIWQNGTGTEQFNERFQQIADMLNIRREQSALTISQQEQWARMTEAYLFGKGTPAGRMPLMSQFLQWVPAQYEAIENLQYLGEDGQYHNPVLTDQAMNLFDALYQNGIVATSPAIDFKPTENKDHEVLVADTETQKERVKTLNDGAVKGEGKDLQLSEIAQDKTLYEDKKTQLWEEVVAEKEETTPAEKPNFIQRVFAGRGTNTQAQMQQDAIDWIKKNPKHAERLVEGTSLEDIDNGLFMNDSGIEATTLFLTYAEQNKDTLSPETYRDIILKAEVYRSFAGKAGGLTNYHKSLYLDAYKYIIGQRTQKLALARYGNVENAVNLLDADLTKTAEKWATRIAQTESNSDQRKQVVNEMVKEMEQEFGQTLDGNIFYQEDIEKLIKMAKSDTPYIKNKAKSIAKKLAKLEIQEAERNQLTHLADNAQKAIDSGALNSNNKEVLTKACGDIKAYQDFLGKETINPTKYQSMVQELMPRLMLSSPSTHITNIFSNTIEGVILSGTLKYQYRKYGNVVDSSKIEQARKHIADVYSLTGINLAQISDLKDSSLVGGEYKMLTPDSQANWLNKWLDPMRWLAKEDNRFRNKQFVYTIAYIASEDAKGDSKKANELFEEYLKIGNKSENAIKARHQAVLCGELATFTQNGAFARAMTTIRKALDTVSFGKDSKGLGTFLMPFVKTPSNIIQMGAEAIASPFTVGYKMYKGQELNLSDRLAVGNLISSAILFGLASALGIVYEPKKNKYDYKGDSLVFGGVRFKMSNFGVIAAPLRQILLISNAITGKGKWSQDTLNTGISTLPGFDALDDLTQLRDKPIEFFNNTLGNATQRLVPSIARYPIRYATKDMPKTNNKWIKPYARAIGMAKTSQKIDDVSEVFLRMAFGYNIDRK